MSHCSSACEDTLLNMDKYNTKIQKISVIPYQFDDANMGQWTGSCKYNESIKWSPSHEYVHRFAHFYATCNVIISHDDEKSLAAVNIAVVYILHKFFLWYLKRISTLRYTHNPKPRQSIFVCSFLSPYISFCKLSPHETNRIPRTIIVIYNRIEESPSAGAIKSSIHLIEIRLSQYYLYKTWQHEVCDTTKKFF